MNDRDIISAFESFADCADGAAVEEKVREKMEKKTGITFRKPIRAAALIAAVLIIVSIPVAAFGVYYRYVTKPFEGEGVRTTDENGNMVYRKDGYYVSIDGEFVPVKLSESKMNELKQYVLDFSNGTVSISEDGKKFDSYRELNDWLGCELLTTDLLGGKPANVTLGGDITLWCSGTSDRISAIQITSSHRIVGTDASCNFNISIPFYDVTMDNMGWGLIGSDMTEVKKIVTANDINVEIVETEMEMTHAYFIKGGVLYTLSIFDTIEEAAPIFEQIISSMK